MYTLEEIRKELEEGPLKHALLKLRLFALEHDLQFPYRWATLELYGYTEYLDDTEKTLSWWRDCQIAWIDHNNKVVGTEFNPERDQAWVYFGIDDIEKQNKSGLPDGEFKIPPPEGKETEIQFGLVEIQSLYDRIREVGLILLLDIDELLNKKTDDSNSKKAVFDNLKEPHRPRI